ncbi:response regulator transcription factor [Azospirillum sp.]|uniref:response regulator transcription factor n=1 Tax=Azospirillum sp. TaxID=34012 RepID=UPI002D39F70D|nr:response regulator transcription factor [Azospirillum sp.]HYF89221.1 response regulator transcription factor [Azospirillum sp.]
MDQQARYDAQPEESEIMPSHRVSTTESFRFLIVDDQALVRFGLSLALQQHYAGASVAEAGTLSGALHQLKSEPDLTAILYDLNLDDSDGLDGLTAILEAAGDVPLIVVSGSGDGGTVASCIRAGARAFVHKGCEMKVLEQALPIVLSGGIFAPAVPAGHNHGPIRIPLSSTPPLPKEFNPVDGLTDRQRQVLCLLLDGQSNKEIARALGVLEGTIKVHLRTVMQRLGVRNRTQLALAAVKAGVVSSVQEQHGRNPSRNVYQSAK